MPDDYYIKALEILNDDTESDEDSNLDNLEDREQALFKVRVKYPNLDMKRITLHPFLRVKDPVEQNEHEKKEKEVMEAFKKENPDCKSFENAHKVRNKVVRKLLKEHVEAFLPLERMNKPQKLKAEKFKRDYNLRRN
jgi:hypothetical protein